MFKLLFISSYYISKINTWCYVDFQPTSDMTVTAAAS